jgi:diguanylate cyclase (GGDEF)-like protein
VSRPGTSPKGGLDELSRGILEAVPGCAAVLDDRGVILAVNTAWTRFGTQNGVIPGIPAPGTTVGCNYLSAMRRATRGAAAHDARQALEGIEAVLRGVAPDFSFDYPCELPTGSSWRNLRVTPLSAGGRCVVAQHSDITRQKEAESEIHALSFYDPLTRLPNRRQLNDRIGEAMDKSVRLGRYGALLCLDLDQFKNINDTLGHSVGDRFLVETGRRIRSILRDGDTAACTGGDGFAIIAHDLSADTAQAVGIAGAIAQRAAEVVAMPFYCDGREVQCTAGIGVALFRGREEPVDDVFKNADLAMNQAKDAGTNALRFFDPAARAALLDRIALEADLRKALVRGQLHLQYQPQVDSRGTLLGAEALLRWTHPERGAISPNDFIPMAEENGMILSMGLWVLTTVCAQLKAWETSPITDGLRLAVNVSARQFRQGDFVGQVREVLARTGARPSRLKIELTESMVLDNVAETLEKMQILKSLGIGFSLDDFGTGNSSLSYLTRLPLEQLKIDRSFVRNLPESRSDAVIAQTIIAMASGLGLQVIAEGVETQAQRAFLEGHGCLAFQGFLFSRPLGLAALEEFARQSIRRPAPAMLEVQC